MDEKQLNRQRQVVMGKINRIQDFLHQCRADMTSVKRQVIEIRARHLEACWLELCQTQDKIEQLCTDEELDKEIKEREQAENIQYDLESQIADLLSVLPPLVPGGSPTYIASTRTDTAVNRVKLPTIDLPRFSGSYQQWTSYQDLFVSLVHNNNQLTPVQKLFYLKSSLDGEAKGLLNAFPSTNDNYSEAWGVLIKRYQNKRVIVNTHISALMNLKPVVGDQPGTLKKLLDSTVENIRALSVQGEAVQHWNSLLVHLTTSKLDPESRKQWELSLKDQAMPTFEQLQDFLELRCRALEAANHPRQTKPSTKPTSSPRHAAVYHAVTQSCEICKQQHPIYKCEEFMKKSVFDRINLAKAKSLCFNCLRPGHSAQACKSSCCKKCSKRHHTLLHREAATTSNKQEPAAMTVAADSVLNCVGEVRSESHVLLATALIRVRDNTGSYQQCRALLDSGSQASFVTENCMQRLRLRRHYSNTSVRALGQSNSTASRGAVMCHFTSSDQTHIYFIEALVLPKITGLLPQRVQNPSSWSHLKELNLADPAFFQPGEVDILLGADIYAELTLSGKRKGPAGTPTAQQTTLGWILSGIVSSGSPSLEVISHHVTLDLDGQLRRFWEIEELPGTRTLSVEEQLCEAHFQETYSRDETGRFTVRLPFNSKVTQELGESKLRAVDRLKYMEARFGRQPQLYLQYREFMQEYIELGHMSKVTSNQNNSCTPYYIPHHAVRKEESTTTKLRVVFDASSKTSTGVSLNEKLLAGPTVQDGLLAIVLRFRIYPLVFTADLAKMFRQVIIHKDDRHNQRIVWRERPQDPIEEYELNTVTYGTACGTYLATKTLQQLAADELNNFPLAAQVLKSDFYVDDLMSGAMTMDEAVKTQKQLIGLLSAGGFELRKWTANNPQLLNHLPCELRATEESFALAFDASVKTLGLIWHPNQDHFSFLIKPTKVTTITKRTILSVTAQLFDPLGWLSPFIIRPKLLMQKLWLVGVSWDDPLPPEIV